MRGALLALFLLAPATAGAFDLALPLDCTLNQSCFVQHLPDHDPSPGTRDFTCGTLTYDGHDGTDFALPSLAAMAEGVKVLAAAPGIVRGVRDGVPDIAVSDPAAPPLQGRDCGNGVAITHEGGWETQYCHMKQGSVRVKVGDRVETGMPLGEVGLSGGFSQRVLGDLQGGVEITGIGMDLVEAEPGGEGGRVQSEGAAEGGVGGDAVVSVERHALL